MAATREIEYSERPFRQHVVDAVRLRRAADGRRLPAVRQTVEGDVPEVLAAVAQAGPDSVRWTPSPDRYWHHARLAPGAVALVCHDAGSLAGAVSAYGLDWLTDGRVTTVLVIEQLVACSLDAGLALLRAVQAQAIERGIRGVIVEHPGVVAMEDMRAAGVVPSLRGMLCSRRSRTTDLQAAGDVACDVK